MRFRTDVFKVVEQNNYTDLDDFFDDLCADITLQNRIIQLGSPKRDYQFDVCENTADYTFGWIRRVNNNHPMKGRIDEPTEEEIELLEGEQIFDKTYFLYNKVKNIILIQFNNGGPRKNTLVKYLDKLHKDYAKANGESPTRQFNFIPIQDNDIYKKLNDVSTTLKVLQIKPYMSQSERNSEAQMSEIGNAFSVFDEYNTEYIFKDLTRGFLKKIFNRGSGNSGHIQFEDFEDYYEKVRIKYRADGDDRDKSISLSDLFMSVTLTAGSAKSILESEAKEVLRKVNDRDKIADLRT